MNAPGWRYLAVAGWLVVLGGAGRAGAQEAVRIQERFPAGYVHHVRALADLSGSLTLPAAKGKPAAKPITIRGDSALEYDERILTLNAKSEVTKTIRLYKRMDFRRKVADQPQETSLRPAVRRLVVLRHKHMEVPFSPDGPLTWGEIDQVRTDVFTPALVGLMPDRAVRVGERWRATTSAVQELTDLERIEEGSLECRLEKVETVAGKRQARVGFSGTVRGTNEDGPSRQRLQGHYTFDLASNYLSYLQIQGTHSLLDKDGAEVGRIEGRFALMRQVKPRVAGLTDAALKGVALEPNADNTLLLYDNPELGVRLLYPRRWRVAGVRGRQLTLDGADGSGLMLTLDPLARAPTGVSLLAESREFLEKQKARIVTVSPSQRLAAGLEHCALEVEMGGQKFWMDYFVARQANGGATIAARLPPRDLAALRQEVERIARSLVVTKKIIEEK
jgi:hypothetical protein